MTTFSSLARHTRLMACSHFVTRSSATNRGRKTKRSLLFSISFISLLSLTNPGLAPAQTDPFVGTWKLDTAKSTPIRKSETRIVESSPSGMKVSVDRTNADGSNQQFSYTANLDGKPYPFVGTAPYGADSVGVTLGTSNTLTYKLWRGGKVIGSGTLVVSADGKTATLKSKGTNEKGKTESSLSIYTKQ